MFHVKHFFIGYLTKLINDALGNNLVIEHHFCANLLVYYLQKCFSVYILININYIPLLQHPLLPKLSPFPLNSNKANNNSIEVLFAKLMSFAFANNAIKISSKNSSVLLFI